MGEENMVKNEWKQIFRNKLFLIVLGAILFIPSIYTTLFLSSMWDPYGKLEQMPVAVVNLDQSVEYQNKTLAVGDELVKKLKEDSSLDFHFVDQKKAEKGIHDGTYYMVITIPKEFSTNAATLMDAHPKQMKLDYETNPGTNYIASKLSNTAMEKIQHAIADEVTRTYAESVFEQLSTVGIGLEEGAEGADRIGDGTDRLLEGNKKICTNLGVLENSTLLFEDGCHTLQKGIKEYTDGVNQLTSGAEALSDGAKDLSIGSVALSEGAKNVQEGTSSLHNGVKTLYDNFLRLHAGTESISEGSSDLKAGISNYTNGVNALETGVDALADLSKIDQVSQGIVSVNEAVNGAGNGQPGLKDASKKVSAGLNIIDLQVQNLINGSSSQSMQNLAQGLSEVEEEVDRSSQNLKQSTNALSSSVQDVQNVVHYLNSGATTVEQAAELLDGTVASLQSQVDQNNARMQSDTDSISCAINTIETVLNTSELEPDVQVLLRNALTELQGCQSTQLMPISGTDCYNQLQKLSVELSNSASQVKAGQETIGNAITDLNQHVQTLQNESVALERVREQIPKGVNASSIQVVAAEIHNAATGASAVARGMDSLASGLSALQESTQAFPDAAIGMEKLKTGVHALTQNNQTLIQGAEQLQQGAKALVGGSEALEKGIEHLSNGSETLVAGTESLKNGTQTLQSGTKQVFDGAFALKLGANTLSSNNEKLLAGGSTLADSSVKLQNGAEKLQQGSLQVQQGLGELENGSEELTLALSDGARKIQENRATEETLDMFATPVISKETKITNVPDNGSAMSAYMMCVGLWVGALAFCLMYPLTAYEGKLKNGASWWLSKATVAYPMAVAMACIMLFLLHLFCGFSPVDFPKTTVVACVASCTFMSIMYFFNAALGKVGSFLMLIFMVLQLSGAAGTYPIELSAGFVAKIHKYLPFSYVVEAFRMGICGEGAIGHSMLLLGMWILVFVGLTILLFTHRAKK